MLPLIYLQITEDYDVGVETIAFLAAFGSFASGARPAELRVADPAVLAAQAARRRRPPVRRRLRRPGVRHDVRHRSRSPTSLSRIGGSPQHPVGNGLLAEQFPPERRGFAISAHIAGGNVGTVVVRSSGPRSSPPSAGAARRSSSASRRSSSPSRSCCSSARPARTGPRPSPAAASATRSGGSVRDRDLRWLYLTSVLGGGGRGLGVVNLFVLIYLTDGHRPRRDAWSA